ncbi:hypothetical protein [Roseibium algicola]|uniref:hypothetical protein n=1 Tax=Roseibium algicola TaxID=2857014 RepID=UPI0012EB6DBC|nr:hypothetical protein [Roseibium aggregatum]
MTGQEAYEEDVRRCPLYPHNGKPRPQWDDLSDLIKSTWNKYPDPREYANKRKTA